MRPFQPRRRRFLSTMATATAAGAILPRPLFSRLRTNDPPATNIRDALKIPRTKESMPGRYPGRVVEAFDPASVRDGQPVAARAAHMLEQAMLELTGVRDIGEAWSQFVSPGDIVGLKVNPVAGKLLSTSLDLTDAVITQLGQAGIPRDN
ncbi:MAG: hypothetical protein KFH87_03215, partial [Bacteroidetes bacterium]|nr:hypothetical protein [Bacteroidota bacterium]